MIVLDFETHPIVSGAPRSPEPVGVALYGEQFAPRYLSWGHPVNNSHTFGYAKQTLEDLFVSRQESILCHNAQFDLRVLKDWFGISIPPEKIHDSKIAAFLRSPDNATLSLKPLSAEWLGMPPAEEARMHEWLRENYPPAKRASNPTKYTAFAPADMVQHYAIGDVLRTFFLWHFVTGEFSEWEWTAYRRECDILPVVVDMESRGIRIDAGRLERDLSKVLAIDEGCLDYINKRLGDVNINSRQQLSESLQAFGLLNMDKVAKTPTGQIAVGVSNLRESCVDQELVDRLELHSKISKLVGTYMRPWLKSASENNGYFFPYVNPTRVDAASGGTRTGRFSSNFQQVPKARFGGLPYMRDYVLPDPGHVLIDRDYSQQELRIFADYLGGALSKSYVDNPSLDLHDRVRELIQEKSGSTLDRKAVKICNFLTIYGGGVNRLAEQLGVDENTAATIRNQHRQVVPIKGLQWDLESQFKKHGYIRTWGGRKLRVDPGYEYKLLNALIQGSAADQTKEAIRRLRLPDGARLMLQVHDELLVSAPAEIAQEADAALREAMEFSEGWTVPMLSDGVILDSWGASSE